MSTESKVKGTVVRFFRGRGFGFIKPEEGGDEVFVHWEDLVTDDHWPFVEKGTEVEFLTADGEEGKPAAKEVTLANGEKIPIFTKPYEDREVNEEETFKGAVKFFDGRKGFGFLKPDEDITWQDATSGLGLFFSRDALLATNPGKGMVLRVGSGLRVSFKIYKDKKGLGACKIQNEDETPLACEPRKEKQGGNRKRKRSGGDGNKKSAKKAKTKEELIAEREIDEDENIYTGTVKNYNAEKEFGFITIAEDITFKDITVKEKIFVMKEDIVCYSDEVGLKAESEVIFKIYKDSKGLGACEVMNADGTPIEYDTNSNESNIDVAKKASPEPVKPKKKVTRKKKKVVKRKRKN